MLITSKSHQVSNGFSYFDDLSQPTEELGGAKTVLGNGKIGWVQTNYRIVASTNTCYYSENQLFVKRSQYIRTENPLHKQSEKAKTCH